MWPSEKHTNEIRALAELYPNGLELNQADKVMAYYEVGAIMPAASKRGSRSGVYGKDLVQAFKRTWEISGGLPLATTTLKLCRQVSAAFSRDQVKGAIEAGVSWSALSALSHTRVSQELRTKLLDKLRRGKITNSQIRSVVDKLLADTPRNTRHPTDRLKVLSKLHEKIEELDRSLNGLYKPIRQALFQNSLITHMAIEQVEEAMDALRTHWRSVIREAKDPRENWLDPSEQTSGRNGPEPIREIGGEHE